MEGFVSGDFVMVNKLIISEYKNILIISEYKKHKQRM